MAIGDDDDAFDCNPDHDFVRPRRRSNPRAHGNPPPWAKPLRYYEVTDRYGHTHELAAHFCFNNAGEGLIFRQYPVNSDRTEIVAAFADGSWDMYKEVKNVVEG